jgi:ArsR family transcriptional regulator
MRKCAYITNIKVIIMRDFVKLFKALSDETRLRMLNILLERECCVCEVMQVLDISQTRASRNLAALYEAGFLKLRRDGFWSLYSIDMDDMNEFVADLVQAVAKAMEGNKMLEQDRQRLKKAMRVGPSCAEKMRGENTIA